MDRRTFLQRAAGAAALYLMPHDLGVLDVALERHLRDIPLGRITKPLPDFTGMSPNPNGDMFTGVDLDRRCVKNLWTPNVGDGHATMTTPRDLPLGVTAADAFDWRYDALEQTGRNLIWQVQMEGSPIAAISTERKTKRWTFVERVGGSEHRWDLGPIDFGKWTTFIVAYKLANTGGFVTVWRSTDWRLRDPIKTVTGDTWQNGRNGHCTLGQYASGTKPMVGYFSTWARAATPARAVELAA